MKSEALTLEWGDIDLHRNQLTVQAKHAKNGESRTIPLNSVLREALSKLKKDSAGEGRVFLSRKGELSGVSGQHLQRRAAMLTFTTSRHIP